MKSEAKKSFDKLHTSKLWVFSKSEKQLLNQQELCWARSVEGVTPG